MFSGPYYLPKSYHPYSSHTYGEIGGPDGYLANLRTFASHSMCGGWEHDGKGRRLFSVYSFGTRIAFCYDGEQPSVSVGKYGPTTSRHQDLCRAWLGRARLARRSGCGLTAAQPACCLRPLRWLASPARRGTESKDHDNRKG